MVRVLYVWKSLHTCVWRGWESPLIRTTLLHVHVWDESATHHSQCWPWHTSRPRLVPWWWDYSTLVMLHGEWQNDKGEGGGREGEGEKKLPYIHVHVHVTLVIHVWMRMIQTPGLSKHARALINYHEQSIHNQSEREFWANNAGDCKPSEISTMCYM